MLLPLVVACTSRTPSEPTAPAPPAPTTTVAAAPEPPPPPPPSARRPYVRDPDAVAAYGIAHDMACAACGGPSGLDAVSLAGSSAPGKGSVADLLDDDPSTVWCAPTSEPPRITLAFDAPNGFWGVEVLGGDFRSPRSLARHGRPAVIEVALDGGRTARWRLDDPLVEPSPRPEDFRSLRPWFEQAREWLASGDYFFADDAPTTTLTLRVVETWPADSEDVCIASVVLWVVAPEEVE